MSKPTSYQGKQIEAEEYTIVKKDIKQFVLQILCTLLERKMDGFDKEIEELCLFLAKEQN